MRAGRREEMQGEGRREVGQYRRGKIIKRQQPGEWQRANRKGM
jgi:hypothetical protein